jgi:hypothetical protein
MLTNYLRSGVASNTYLPLAGGTVTGNTNFVPTTGRVIFGETSSVWDEVLGVRPRTTTSLGLGIYSSLTSYSGTLFRAQSENSTGSSYMLYEGRGNGGSAKFWVKGDGSSFFAKNMTIGSETNYDALNIHHSGDEGFRMSYITQPTSYFFQIRPYQSANNVTYVFSQTNNNIFYDSVFVLNQGNIGINKLNPAYKLDVNGTLGVTGAITLSNLAGSGTRMVTASSTGLLSSQTIPSGTLVGADTVSLSNRINTKVGLSGNETINGVKTFSAPITSGGLTLTSTTGGTNRLLGLNSSGGAVGQITVGSGLNLTGDNLTANIPIERYYFNLGIVAGAADNSNATYDFTYGSNVLVIPTSLNGYCIDSVYIRAVGCSTCPPVAGDKDYYVGVYKASAGNRITTLSATLVGSQITMNEYDLNEINRNDTLTTGDVWWVYLNGTFTSDMAYITAGFVVKQTCN